jgi:hypothetical protein
MATASGCAHRPMSVAPLDLRSNEVRYAGGVAAREALAPGTIAEVSLWLETAAYRYPGVHGTIGIGGRDSIRLRIASAFGTALDAAALEESLFVYVPSRRTAVRAAAADPPLAYRQIARFCARAASATWPMPGEAWARSRRVDSLTILRTFEGADTLEVGVGASGLPRFARLARPGMNEVRVTYLAYAPHEGTPWPTRFEIEDGAGQVRLSVRVRRIERTRERGGARWRPDIPADASALPAADLMRWIEEELTP